MEVGITEDYTAEKILEEAKKFLSYKKVTGTLYFS
jgi:hypothetical protein